MRILGLTGCDAYRRRLKREGRSSRQGNPARTVRQLRSSHPATGLPPKITWARIRETAEALAGLVVAVIQGLSTLARDGAPREKLLRAAAAALTAWPPEA